MARKTREVKTNQDKTYTQNLPGETIYSFRLLVFMYTFNDQSICTFNDQSVSKGQVDKSGHLSGSARDYLLIVGRRKASINTGQDKYYM